MKTLRYSINPPLFLPALACISGAFTGGYLFDDIWAGRLFILLSILSLLYFLRTRTRESFLRFMSVLFFLVCGTSAASILHEEHPENSIYQYSKKGKLFISGTVWSKPELQEKRMKLVLADVSLKEKGQEPSKVQGKLVLYVYGRKLPVRCSDRVACQSEIRLPRNFTNPGGFDYKRYLAFKKIRGIVYTGAHDLTVSEADKDLSFPYKVKRSINSKREDFAGFISSTVENRKSAAVLTLLTTGLTAKVSDRLRQSFSKAGASHILAISGLHLSIVAGIFFAFFNFVFRQSEILLKSGANRKISAFAALVPLTYYALLSGFSPSTQRAYIMIVVFLFAYVAEKQSDGLNSLCAAAVLILLFDPGSLFSPSFQLSFAAVLFIICGFSLLRDLPAFQKKGFVGRVLIFLGISFFAITGTFPIVMYYFNMICFVQLVTSLVIIPILGFVCVPTGIIAFFVFPFIPGLSLFLISVSEPFLAFSINFVEYTAGMFFTWARCVTPHPLELFCYYAFMGTLFLALKYKEKRYSLLFVPVLIAAAVFNAVELKQRYGNDQLKITMLDVGQGSSAFIHAPGGVTILVDAGGFPYSSGFDTGRYIVAPYLWRNRIMNLDAVIMTHPETDHMNGLIYVLKNFKVDLFVKNNDKRDSKAYKKLMEIVLKKEIPLLTAPFEDSGVKVEDTTLLFLNPVNRGRGSFDQKLDYNDRSLVFKLVGNKVSMLFPGDVSSRVEKKMADIHGKKLSSDILIAPHHGSKSSSSAFFLDRVHPKDVLISCGWKNRYGFPATDVIGRIRGIGADIYRTDLNGAVTIRSMEDDYQVVPMKKGE